MHSNTQILDLQGTFTSPFAFVVCIYFCYMDSRKIYW